MSEESVSELWSAFVLALEELSRIDEPAARSIMADVSAFETDWWGSHS